MIVSFRAYIKRLNSHMGQFLCRIYPHVLMTIIEGSFYSTQTLNGHIKTGTDSLIRLIRGTTAKWSQIGAALSFLGIDFLSLHLGGITY